MGTGERPTHRAGRIRWIPVLAAAVLALAGCSDNESVAPPKPAEVSTSGRAASAQRTLTALTEALRSRDAAAAAALATSDAAPAIRTMLANVSGLDLDDLALRFVDDQSVLDDDERTQFGSSAWAGTAELTYRLHGWDAQPVRVETRVVFRRQSGRDLIAGVGGGDGRTPLWLTGPVEHVAAGRALVMVRDHDPSHYLSLAKQALVDVAKVLPGWHGNLVLEVPATEQQLDEALGAPEDRYANIAAVTTSVDGSLVPGSPVHVFLNPRVFDTLGPRGAQVVVSHETTHVATGATFADMPTWLLEGFADYVALDHAGIPVQTAASQILARIRKEGPPDHLPTAADLDPSANGLGATYEEAWLATRFIGKTYGERRLIEFYRRVDAGASTTAAFEEVLGTTEARFVQLWRADLRALAGGVAG